MEAITSDSEPGTSPDAASVTPFWARSWEAISHGRWALYALYLATSWLLTNLYWQVTEQLDTATLAKFVSGEAASPFQYRVLMPWLLGLAARLSGTPDFYAIDVGLRVLTLFGLMLLLRRWMRHFVGPALADVSPLLLAVVLPRSFHFYWPYDFTAILLWTACLLTLVERRYGLYLFLFAIGTLNRETTFLLIAVFAVTQWETLGRRGTLRWGALQAAIWLTIVAGLRLLIHPQGGEPLEFQLRNNFLYLSQGVWLGPTEHWLRVGSAMGYLWLLAPWRWRKKSLFLRRACWMIPLHAALILCCGRLVETRLWYEWIPIALALAGQTVTEFAKQETSETVAAPG